MTDHASKTALASWQRADYYASRPRIAWPMVWIVGGLVVAALVVWGAR